MAYVGPLLQSALARVDASPSTEVAAALAAHFGGGDGTALPVFLQLAPLPVAAGEHWAAYRRRVEMRLRPLSDQISQTMGIPVSWLLAANALQLEAKPDQVRHLSTREEFQLVELDPLVRAAAMDDAVVDVDLAGYVGRHPGADGRGVRVAVLDSGIDVHHPYLQVASSVSTCGESVDLPGTHGTHCAGSLCSRDSVYAGIAPGVSLLNVKVLRQNGTGQATFITKGIDAALDLDAHVLSMSIGFNHLPTWSANGHGWMCTNGACTLCTAVANAVRLEGVVAVVAAGNEHDNAQALRASGYGHSFDTEIACPGQCTEAITVGALTKRTFAPASFSSRGPTAFGTSKPDLAAPGVNVTSTIPAPRNPDGTPVASPPRSLLFGRDSGTSMATPIVAGAAALLVEQAMTRGTGWTPASIRQALLTGGVASLGLPAHVAGAGRLVVANL